MNYITDSIFESAKPTTTINEDFVEYKVLWYGKVFLSHSFFNLYKDKYYDNCSLTEFWKETKHLLSQDELNFYLSFNSEINEQSITNYCEHCDHCITIKNNNKTINITTNDIIQLISNFLFTDQIRFESVLSILTSNTEYLNNTNNSYDRHIHSITYFWLIFISGSIIYYENYNRNFEDYNEMKDKWEKNYNRYKKIFDALYQFGKLKKNDDIYSYPEVPSKIFGKNK